jgi:hypothetical protein
VLDRKAFELIINLLKKCTAKDPHDRPTADRVVELLEELDDALVPGMGVGDLTTPVGAGIVNILGNSATETTI